MNQAEFLLKIIPLFNDFNFDVSSIGSIHGIKSVPTRMFRDSGSKGITNILGARKIFISGQMYPNTDKDFIYCTIYTTARYRAYRCKTWVEHEHKKIFTSGKTYLELLDNLTLLADKIKD
jgi:hypothetical protein